MNMILYAKKNNLPITRYFTQCLHYTIVKLFSSLVCVHEKYNFLLEFYLTAIYFTLQILNFNK